MAKGRKFSDISKQTEQLRQERLPHLSTEKSGKSEELKSPSESQGVETLIKENTEEIQPVVVIPDAVVSDEKGSTSIDKKDEVISTGTPILTEKISVEKKPKVLKEEKKRGEEAVKGENTFTENIRISPYWNQVLTFIQKQNKAKYKSKEVILDTIIQRGIKGIDSAEEIMMFVSSLNKKREA